MVNIDPGNPLRSMLFDLIRETNSMSASYRDILDAVKDEDVDELRRAGNRLVQWTRKAQKSVRVINGDLKILLEEGQDAKDGRRYNFPE